MSPHRGTQRVLMTKLSDKMPQSHQFKPLSVLRQRAPPPSTPFDIHSPQRAIRSVQICKKGSIAFCQITCTPCRGAVLNELLDEHHAVSHILLKPHDHHFLLAVFANLELLSACSKQESMRAASICWFFSMSKSAEAMKRKECRTDRSSVFSPETQNQ